MSWRGVLLLLLVSGLAPSCGSGGLGTDDLTGSWILLPSHPGVPGDAYPVSIVQTGTALSAEVPCQAAFPLGTGTWQDGAFSLTFDFGGGDALVLTGGPEGPNLVGTYTTPEDAGSWRLQRTLIQLDCAHACDPVTPPRFVSTDFTELAKIEEISLFRSSAGHDYSDACESCRSMKHYFAPYAAFLENGVVAVRSPVDGTVVEVSPEGHGASIGLENKQVRIRSAAHPRYTFILFHVDVASAAVTPGAYVLAGQLIGHARLVYPDLMEVAHDFDIAVRYHSLFGDRYVSWFDVMTDSLFLAYQARGVGSRSDLILTADQRDADPLTCMGETFTSTGMLPAWFVLSP
jgi:hypothetical protein